MDKTDKGCAKTMAGQTTFMKIKLLQLLRDVVWYETIIYWSTRERGFSVSDAPHDNKALLLTFFHRTQKTLLDGAAPWCGRVLQFDPIYNSNLIIERRKFTFWCSEVHIEHITTIISIPCSSLHTATIIDLTNNWHTNLRTCNWIGAKRGSQLVICLLRDCKIMQAQS